MVRNHEKKLLADQLTFSIFFYSSLKTLVRWLKYDNYGIKHLSINQFLQKDDFTSSVV